MPGSPTRRPCLGTGASSRLRTAYTRRRQQRQHQHDDDSSYVRRGRLAAGGVRVPSARHRRSGTRPSTRLTGRVGVRFGRRWARARIVPTWWSWAPGPWADGHRCSPREAGAAPRRGARAEDVAGRGASSRAAGMVRAQGGTPDTVRLGTRSIDFYRQQRDSVRHRLGLRGTRLRDPGLDRRRRARGPRARSRCSARPGSDVRWVDADEVRGLIPAMGPTGYRGGVLRRHRRLGGPAPERAGVLARDAERGCRRCASARRSSGCERARPDAGAVRSPGSRPRAGTIATARGAPDGRPGDAGGRRAPREPRRGWATRATRSWSPKPSDGPAHRHDRHGVRHRRRDLLAAGGRRACSGACRTPTRHPAPGRAIDWDYLRADAATARTGSSRSRRRLGIKKAWAATIEYTPDHLPLPARWSAATAPRSAASRSRAPAATG